MRYMLFCFLFLVISSCENHSFDADKRQIIAKDEIRDKLHNPPSFDVITFKEDTLESWTDTAFEHPIRYKLTFVYSDSTGKLQNKEGFVMFTPDGKSVIRSEIN